jgi:multicomponent Na+:H+ antiporter subunit F
VTIVATLCIGALIGAAALCVLRMLRPGTLADRSIGLDTAIAMIINAGAVLVVLRDDSLIVDLLLVAGLLGFIGTISVARFIERRGL